MAGSLGDLGETFVRARLDTSQLEAGYANALGRTKAVTAQIESAWTHQGRLIEAAFGRITQAGLAAGRGLTTVGRGFTAVGIAADRAGASVGRFGSTLATTRNLLGGTIAAVAVRQLVGYAAAWENAGLRIRSVSRDTEDARAVQERLFAVAQETGTSFTALAETYQRFTFATEGLNLSQDETIRILTTISKIGVTTGATAVELSNALRQMTQGFASGGLRGDEFRSVAEQLPGVLDAVAAATGKSRLEVIAFAKENGIATETVVESLQRFEDQAADAFDQVSNSISRAQERVSNAFLRLIGDSSEASGATDGLTRALNELADLMESPAFQAGLGAAFAGLGEGIEQIRERIGQFVELGRIISLALTGSFSEAAAAANALGTTVAEQAVGQLGALADAARAGSVDISALTANQLSAAESAEQLAQKELMVARALSELPTAATRKPEAPIPLKGAPSAGGGGGGISDAERTFLRVRDAVEDARMELAEFDAKTVSAQAALQVLQDTGLPFDRVAVDKLIAADSRLGDLLGKLQLLQEQLIRTEAAAKTMEKVEGAVHKADMAMAELEATTLEEQVALELLQATGFTSQRALDEAVAENDILAEQVALLDELIRKRIQAQDAERAGKIIERQVFELEEKRLEAPQGGFHPFGIGAQRPPVQPRAELQAAQQLGLPAETGARDLLLEQNDALAKQHELLTQRNADLITFSERQEDLEAMTAAAGAFAETLSRGLAEAIISSDWQQFAENIIHNLIQMAIQAAITAAIMSAIAPFSAPAQTAAATSTLSFLTALVGGGGLGRQHGGPVRAGERYFVGEAGPEMFVPSTSGMIIPNRDIGSTFNTQIDARGASAGVGAEIIRALTAFEKRMPKVLAESDRRGLSGRKVR